MHWKSLDLRLLPTLADAWELVDGFAEVPERFYGSLLLASTRDRAVLAELADGRVILWIHWREPAAVVTQGETTWCLPAQPIRQDRAWFLAFLPEGQGTPRIPIALPQGKLELVEHTISIGGKTTLAPIPRTLSWDWAWGPTIGPVYLNLFVEQSAEELLGWLRTRLPHHYQFDTDRVLYPHQNTDSCLIVAGGQLSLGHRFHWVDHAQDGYDAFVLWAAVLGEFGELTFDLFDGDYGYLNAVGYSRESLRDYLMPGPGHSRKHKHRWTVLPEITILPEPDADLETCIAQELNRYTGLPLETPLTEIFQRTPLSELPRRIEIHLPRDVPIPAPETLTLPLTNRIRWGWVQGAR